MGRRIVLLTVFIAVLAGTVSPASASSKTCGIGDFVTGCSVGGSVGEGEATLHGSLSQPGSPGSSGGSGSGGSGGGGAGGGGNGGGGANVDAPDTLLERCNYFISLRCQLDSGRPRGETAPPTAAPTPPTRPITINDIASFRPAPGVQYMQPDGWTVPGLHTNFYAVVGTQVVDGTLLGQPASVRFTPVAYHWNYGDGSSATLGTAGSTWQSLGVAEFDATPTSHVYDVEGEYVIRLTIDFAVEYRFAGGHFIPLSGRIPLPANELRITVGGAKTVLVEQDCAVNPAGPGC